MCALLHATWGEITMRKVHWLQRLGPRLQRMCPHHVRWLQFHLLGVIACLQTVQNFVFKLKFYYFIDEQVVRETAAETSTTTTSGKRSRTAFTPIQLLVLETAFEKNHYVVGLERKQLAVYLKLTEQQVKVWYQNRRTKYKKNIQQNF